MYRDDGLIILKKKITVTVKTKTKTKTPEIFKIIGFDIDMRTKLKRNRFLRHQIQSQKKYLTSRMEISTSNQFKFPNPTITHQQLSSRSQNQLTLGDLKILPMKSLTKPQKIAKQF